MIFNIPEWDTIEINTLVFNLNWTLAVSGEVSKDVEDKLSRLKELGYDMVLLSGDVRGNAKELCNRLGIKFIRARTSEEKKNEIKKLNPETCAAIGNARIDNWMFKEARVAIAVLQEEWIHVDVIKYTDLILPSISDALNLFIDEKIFMWTMRP